jgi:hypothetical protein
MKDLMSVIDVKPAIKPVSVSDNTAQVGQVIDRRGFAGVTYLIATGSIAAAAAAFAVKLEESDSADMTGAADVDAADLIGTTALAGFATGDGTKCRKLGYKGAKRYTRLTITPSGNDAAALFSAVAVLHCPDLAPTANPPA